LDDKFNPFRLVNEATRIIKEMVATIDVLPTHGLPAAKLAEIEREKRKFRFLLRLADLFQFYMMETQRCLEAKAFFSANIVGAATLETMLLMKAILEESRVLQTEAWQSSHKKAQIEFTDKLLKSDIRLLLAVAEELHWMGDTSPIFAEQLALYLGPEVTRELFEHAPEPREAARWAQQVRNMIHPERCIKEQFEPSDEHGTFAFFCLVQAFSAFPKSA
jgi:hypothetical protein